MRGMSFFKGVLGALVGGAMVWSLSLVMAEDGPAVRSASRALQVPSAITYQGRLDDADGPVSGPFDFRFTLWDAETAGASLGTIDDTLTVSDGLFSALLDFGGTAFNGQPRWIEVSVRSAAGQDPYEVIGGRQPVTAAPYALYANFADTIYHRTVLVRPLGTGEENGAALDAAMAGITTASANERWLVKLEPGLYDVGAAGMTGKDFVDIEGSGRQGTVIRGSSAGVLRAGANTEIRDLAVESINPGPAVTVNIGLEIPKANVLITRVRVVVNGGTLTARGIVASSTGATITDTDVIVNSPNAIYAVYTVAGSANTTLRRVTVTASGSLFGGSNFNVYGVRLENSGAVTLEDVVATAYATLGAGNGGSGGLSSVQTNVTVVRGRFEAGGSSDSAKGADVGLGTLTADGAVFQASGTAGENLAVRLSGVQHTNSMITNSRLVARGGASDTGIVWVGAGPGTTTRLVGNSFDADVPFSPLTALTFYRCVENNAFSNANPNGAFFASTCPN